MEGTPKNLNLNQIIKQEIGNTLHSEILELNWVDISDDKKIQGKIKSIGSTTYVWYNSNDRREYQGALKSGNVEQVVAGINFIIM